MLAPLSNGVIFQKAFTDKEVLEAFVHDLVGIDFKAGRIETEKKFKPPVGNIDFSYDIFSESEDHRLIVEMQRIVYDVNFDRFLHYHFAGVIEQQKKQPDKTGTDGEPVREHHLRRYQIDRQVYTLVILSEPYKLLDRNHRLICEPVIKVKLDTRTPDGKAFRLYDHELVFINPFHPYEHLDEHFRAWLDLLKTSFFEMEPEGNVNMERPGIRRVVELIDYEAISAADAHEMMMWTESDEKYKRLLKESDEKDSRLKTAEAEILNKNAQLKAAGEELESLRNKLAEMTLKAE